MNLIRRCCPGCGAPAPLALGQDWCRYCSEYIGVSLDMAEAVQSPVLEHVEEPETPKYWADSFDSSTQVAPLFHVPSDWMGKLGRAAVSVLCLVIVAVPMVFALWAVAVSVLGQS